MYVLTKTVHPLAGGREPVDHGVRGVPDAPPPLDAGPRVGAGGGTPQGGQPQRGLPAPAHRVPHAAARLAAGTPDRRRMRFRTNGEFEWETSSRGPFRDAPPDPCHTSVARTDGYTYAARVWALPRIKGRVCVAPCPKPSSSDPHCFAHRCTPSPRHGFTVCLVQGPSCVAPCPKPSSSDAHKALCVGPRARRSSATRIRRRRPRPRARRWRTWARCWPTWQRPACACSTPRR
jgi:hypothetical protein